jgi:hypothetical protein
MQRGTKLIDLSGMRFGKLQVIRRGEDWVGKNHSAPRWVCLCDCGKTTLTNGSDLRRGLAKSCGCLRAKLLGERSKKAVQDITGHKFGRLTAKRRVANKISPAGKQITVWLCSCSCGNEIEVDKASLVTRRTRSCGCYNDEIRRSRKTLPEGESAFNRLFAQYKLKAVKRGFAFELSQQEFRNMTKGFCHYCGEPPTQSFWPHTSATPYIYNGVDRKDNNKGYRTDNCVSCCGPCNKLKMNLSYEEFFNLINRIALHQADIKIEEAFSIST